MREKLGSCFRPNPMQNTPCLLKREFHHNSIDSQTLYFTLRVPLFMPALTTHQALLTISGEFDVSYRSVPSPFARSASVPYRGAMISGGTAMTGGGGATISPVAALLNRAVVDLPPLPLAVLRLLQLTGDDNASSATLAKVVETEPSIAAKVLKMVNSASFGQMTPVSNVQRAIALMGFRTVRTLALEAGLFSPFSRHAGSRGFGHLQFWQHSLAVACIARALAGQVGHPRPDEVYMAGLLHDIGKMVLEVFGRIRYSQFLERLDPLGGPLIEEEIHMLGVGHDEVGAYIAELWRLPEPVCLAIRHHHRDFPKAEVNADHRRLVALVALADGIAWTQGAGLGDVIRQPSVPNEVYRLVDLDQIDLATVLAETDREIQSISKFYDFHLPSVDQLRARLLRTNLALDQRNSEFRTLQEELSQKVDTLTHAQDRITHPHHSLEPDVVVASTLESLRSDFGFQRIAFLKFLSDTRTLECCYIHPAIPPGAEPLRLIVHEELPGLVQCLRQRAPRCQIGSTAAEIEFSSRFGSPNIGFVPVIANHQVIGVVVIGRASGRSLEPQELATVGLVVSELGVALHNASLFDSVRHRAYHDALTGLLNRGTLDERLLNAFEEARQGLSMAVCLLDIDHFKRFNDVCGHLVGDNVLKLVAAQIRKACRPNDIVGRYGGEEFLVILQDVALPSALQLAERLRREIERLGQMLSDRFQGQFITVSIGVTSYHSALSSPQALIAKVDAALYKAKNAGRNRIVAG
ncbi:Signal transduction family protein (GGDEF domain-containing protein) [Gammaproteobacteria bacterium]